MKLHLPKLLLTAVLAVCATPVALAETYTITGNDDTHLDSATSTDTIIFNKDGGHLYKADGSENYPKIEIEAAVEIDKLKLTDGYSGSYYTFKNTVSGSGEFSFSGNTGANNQHYIFEGDMSGYTGTMTIASNKNAEFIFKGIAVGATSISGANVQFTDGASTSATIDINAGKLLILGHEAQGGYAGGFQGMSVDLSGATVNLNGGNVRFNGDESFLGTLNVKQDGTLRLEDCVSGGTNSSGSTAGKGLNIATLNLESNLTVTNCWKATLDIAQLTGEGSVSFSADNGETVNVKVNSVDKGALIRSNAAFLTLGDDGDSVINLSGTIANTGSVTVKGALMIDADSGKFKVYETGTLDSYSLGDNGFATFTGSKLYAFEGAGSVAIGDTGTVKLGDVTSSLEAVDGKGYVFSVTGEYTDKTTFLVNKGDVVIGEGDYTEASGLFDTDSFVLADGTSLNINNADTTPNARYFAGKTFELGAGATLKNEGTGLNGNHKMFAGMVLNGDAAVHAGSNMGLQNMTSDDGVVTNSTLTLNEHTLTKSGGGAFFLTATQVTDTGTIKISEGTLQVGVEVGKCQEADTNAAGVHFQLDGGTLNINMSGNKLIGKSLSGSGTVSGNGVLQLENNGTAASHTITGNVKVGALYLLGKDSYTINGNLTVSGAENGYAKLRAGNVTLGEGTHSIGRMDLSDGNKCTTELTLNKGAHLTATGTMWIGQNSSIKVKDGASFTAQGVKFEAKSDAADATISFLASTGDEYALTNANYQINNAKVSVAANESGTTLAFILDNSELVNTGSGTLTASNAANVLSGIDASTGNIDIINSQAQSLSALSIGAGKTVGIYSASSVPTDPTSTDEATVTTSSLTVDTGATLNANLVLSNGATVTMADALTMGSTVTLGEGMTLAGDLVSTIKGMSDDGTVNLFTGVDELYLGDSTMASGTLDATSGVNLNTYFNFDGAGDYYLGYDGQNVFAGVMQTPVTPAVPEPTTATLSLLALAALASRRRRK